MADPSTVGPSSDVVPVARRRLPASALTVSVVVAALLILVTVQAFVLQVFLVPSASMATTVDSGDRVLVNKLAYRFGSLDRGDVVVFDGDESWDMATAATGGPDNPENTVYMKRVIGLPGERVTCCDADGRLMIDGIPLDEPYLHPGDAPSEDRFDIRVPLDRVWVMGDHRSASADSRAHIGDPGGGAIPVDSIVGRVVAVVWPVSSAEVVDRPSAGPSRG